MSGIFEYVLPISSSILDSELSILFGSVSIDNLPGLLKFPRIIGHYAFIYKVHLDRILFKFTYVVQIYIDLADLLPILLLPLTSFRRKVKATKSQIFLCW